jgi:hypothetical protein
MFLALVIAHRRKYRDKTSVTIESIALTDQMNLDAKNYQEGLIIQFLSLAETDLMDFSVMVNA